MKTPPLSSDDGGVFIFGRRWQHSSPSAKRKDMDQGQATKEARLPIPTLLARIRRLIPGRQADHYEEIVRGFGNGVLRPPPTPMSDRELAQAIAEFLKDTPSAENVSSLGRKLDPSTPV